MDMQKTKDNMSLCRAFRLTPEQVKISLGEPVSEFYGKETMEYTLVYEHVIFSAKSEHEKIYKMERR